MIITPLLKEHWAAVEIIYQEGIDTNQATFEITTPSWNKWNEGHLAHSRLVGLDKNKVIGWAALSPVSSRPVYRGVAEVSIYISTAQIGKGYGKKLLAELIQESEKHGIWTLQATTFPENEASVNLHKHLGFKEIGYRENIAQQHGVWRSTVMMERRSSLHL